MELGTAEPIIRPETIRKSGSRVATTGGTASSNGPTGGKGDDSNTPDFGRFPLGPSETGNGDKAKIVAWFVLLVVGMTFAGLIAAYVMISTNQAAEWKPFDLPIQIWISTIIILLSSVSYHGAQRAIEADRTDAGRKWLLVTTVLGAAFISSQILAWLALTKRGLYMQGNPYAGFFYIFTAVHLVHVLGGIIALGSIVLSSWHGGGMEHDRVKRRKLARAVGWYWHFMGGLWIVLFVLLGFWR